MDLQDVIDQLNDLEEDSSVPKNVKACLSQLIVELKGDKDLSLKVNKCLSQLDDIGEDVNIPPFVRTRIFSVASMLEAIN